MRIDTLRRCCRKIPGLRDQFLRLLRGEMDSCRYCLEGSDGEALISCCACRGTLGFVHFSCLEKAFDASSPGNAFFCSVCGGRFADNVAIQLGESGLRKYGRTSSVGGMLLSWLGLAISESGDAQRALTLCEEGLAIVGSYAGTNSRPYSICLTNLSVVFTELGQHLKARDVLQRALVVDQQSGSEEDVATSIKNLGYAYWNLGDYVIAQRHLENALACFERTQGLQGCDVTSIQIDLAQLAGILAAPNQEIKELNPWCFLTLGMIELALALAAQLQSLTILTLGVILLSHMRWRARIADGGGTRSSCSGTCGASHLR